ncbi:MAG: undecaprenyl-phosphate glucose phosphotransferase [Methylocystis sp.]|nr:undecaprenyl-phosphate glucose phosphotransferase [Methylocystis sp.]MCA3583766.1 undecaprenyl-phosphate glucose phosphotransferase [Methylocystis sp.]MCA3586439.1 undecaprenyl-phosphate glucose phosphotransferase [Methylocystis sp.]MCA3589960.1 undecaprenyl-phosphate glucose phosphotransferase [Methylocystis sp.]
MAIVNEKTGPYPAEPASQPLDQPMLIAGVAMFDTVVIIGAALLAAGLLAPAVAAPMPSPLLLGIAMSAAVMFALQRVWAYTVASLTNLIRQAARLIAGVLGVFGALVVVIYLAGIEELVPRRFVFVWLSLTLAILLVSRVLIAWRIARWNAEGRLTRRAVIVGGGRPSDELIRQLRRSKSAGIKVCGVFDDRAKDRSADPVDRYRVLGTFEELADFCRAEAIDLIIVTLPPAAEERILHLMKKLWVLPIDVRISAHQSKLRLRPRAYTYIGDVPFLAVFDKPLSDWGWALKEIEDRVIAVAALVLLSPVMLAVACAVKLTSKGPVFFKQKRHGFNNQLVEVYKFRSMFTELSDADAVKLVSNGDPRVTPVGRFIRKTSLDELPQLFNVLKGELSLVGPRPHAAQAKAGTRIYNEVVEGYYARHRMKPGMTGLAQIHGWRGETDTEEKLQRRVELDIQYIDNWSIWMDLYILAMTPLSLLNAENAY